MSDEEVLEIRQDDHVAVEAGHILALGGSVAAGGELLHQDGDWPEFGPTISERLQAVSPIGVKRREALGGLRVPMLGRHTVRQ